MFSRQILQSRFMSNVIQYQNPIDYASPLNILSVACVCDRIGLNISIPFHSIEWPMNLFWIITKINCIYQINLRDEMRRVRRKKQTGIIDLIWVWNL